MTRRPPLLAPLLAAALLAGCAGASAPPVPTVAALPTEMAGLRRTGEITDYEVAPGGAGLGASVRYVSPPGAGRMVATVYVYDRRARQAPEGGGSPAVLDELRRTHADAQALTATGRYRAVTAPTGMDLGGRDVPPDMRCFAFGVIQGDGTRTGDGVCVSVRGGRFVKTRVTSWAPPEPVVAGVAAMALMNDALRAGAGR